jgi:drug/metabolite transporter (DMT)-like permease
METMATLLIIGVCNAVCTWPFLFLLDATGVEPFGAPSSTQALQLAGNACLSFIFDLTFALAIFMTNPILVSISAALVIPLSFLADYFLHGTPLYYASFLGTVVVIGGLYVMNVEEGGDDADEAFGEVREEAWEEEKGGGCCSCFGGKAEDLNTSKGSILGRGSDAAAVATRFG